MKQRKSIAGSFILFIAIAVLILSMAVSCNSAPEDSVMNDSDDVATTANSDNSSPGDSIEGDPIDMVVEIYSEHYGVSEDEARLRLDLQGSFPGLESAIMLNEAETFGGLWIQHEPEYKIVVAFTRDGEETITKYSEYIPEKVAPYIEIRTVGKSLNELLDDQHNLLESLRSLGIKADARVYVMDNCVSIDITKSDEAKFNEAVQSGDLVLPERLEVNIVEGLTKLTL